MGPNARKELECGIKHVEDEKVEEERVEGVAEESVALERACMSWDGYTDTKLKPEAAAGVQKLESVNHTLDPLPADGLGWRMVLPVSIYGMTGTGFLSSDTGSNFADL
jgi:hypothetical protein